VGEVRNSLVVEPVVEQSNGVRLTSEAVSAESTIEEGLISALGKRELRGLKQTMKKLRALSLPKKAKESVTRVLAEWLAECSIDDFMCVFRQVVVWASEEYLEDRVRKFVRVLLIRAEKQGFLNDEERMKATKSFLTKAISNGSSS